MRRQQKLFFSVLGISFVGSLPPGVLNTGVTGLAVSGGVLAAVWFGLGAILVEMVIVRIAHAGMGVFQMKRKWLFMGISLVMVTFTVWYFHRSAGVPQYGRYPFLGGVLLSVLNPLHLPFWLGWTAVLRGRNLLANARIEYNLFSAGIGVGTALAFLVYGVAGQLILQLLHAGDTVK